MTESIEDVVARLDLAALEKIARKANAALGAKVTNARIDAAFDFRDAFDPPTVLALLAVLVSREEGEKESSPSRDHDPAIGVALDLDALERVARAATPGPWHHRQAGEKGHGQAYDWIGDHPDRGRHTKVILGRGCLYGGTPDYAHVATFDPPTTLALIALARASSATGSEQREHRDELDCCLSRDEEIGRLKAERDEAHDKIEVLEAESVERSIANQMAYRDRDRAEDGLREKTRLANQLCIAASTYQDRAEAAEAQVEVLTRERDELRNQRNHWISIANEHLDAKEAAEADLARLKEGQGNPDGRPI